MWILFLSVLKSELVLGSPRKPIRLVTIDGEKNLYQPSSKKNLTEDMHDFG